jgi:para-nitrobenzyl esterase
MVYMHGGGFSGGSGHDLLSYDGENLARNHDVVVVTHNHRLNVYGYLNLQELGGEEFISSANVGLLDIVALLGWVRENIATFGGDPGCVTIFGQSGGGGKVLALMAMPAAKGLFHRAIVQSGPFLKCLSQDYSGRLAELVLAELGLTKSRVRELQGIPVDRLSGAAAEAMKKMPSQRNSIRQVYGEDNWGPTMDGRILPRHPFDPGAPEISADVPLLTGSNLHEFVNGLDRPEAQATQMDELQRRVSQEFGERSKEIIDAYRRDYPQATPFDLYATIAAASVRRPACEQALWGERQLTPIYMHGALRFWTDVPARFTALKVPLRSTMLSSAITTLEAALRQSSYQNKSVLLGLVLPEPAIPITTTCHIGRNIARNDAQRCSSIPCAKCVTTPRARD